MTVQTAPYVIEIAALPDPVEIWRGPVLLARTPRARVMYETRLAPTIYVPVEDVIVPLGAVGALQTFCPFKGTATYRSLLLPGEVVENAVWSYDTPLPESRGIAGHVGFMPGDDIRTDLGENVLRAPPDSHLTGSLVDWLLREAPYLATPADFTHALALQLGMAGVALSRFSVMIWSLDPLIAGKNYIWDRALNAVTTFAPSYEIHASAAFMNSPLRHVSSGLGGVRQRIRDSTADESFPIVADLRKKGATDYVAMPLRFSDGRPHVMTMTTDHPDGFSTADLGLVFECSALIARYYEVFVQKENARSLLETYLGRRTGARVLGGEIRRGDGDEIEATIMFCDLRKSTLLEETLGRSAYLDLLNRFFETVSGQVQENGGEVLKFIGDAVLAVFPTGTGVDADAARSQALAAALGITARLDDPHGEGVPDCDCSIGIAHGRVTYGNVGSQERLDFTVIGQAANIAARLGDHGKSCGQRIVVTADVAACAQDSTDLGLITLHNVRAPVRCHRIAG